MLLTLLQFAALSFLTDGADTTLIDTSKTPPVFAASVLGEWEVSELTAGGRTVPHTNYKSMQFFQNSWKVDTEKREITYALESAKITTNEIEAVMVNKTEKLGFEALIKMEGDFLIIARRQSPDLSITRIPNKRDDGTTIMKRPESFAGSNVLSYKLKRKKKDTK